MKNCMLDVFPVREICFFLKSVQLVFRLSLILMSRSVCLIALRLLKFCHSCLEEAFLYYLLNNPLLQSQAAENTRGVGNKNWMLDKIAKTVVFCSPLAEQKRIVARLEELLPPVRGIEVIQFLASYDGINHKRMIKYGKYRTFGSRTLQLY